MFDRPTTDPREVVLDAHDAMWTQLRDRLVGLGLDEYRWAPAEGWSIATGADGVTRVTGAGHADPGPVTTIAWRTWHLAVDCFDSYSERLAGATGSSVSGTVWHAEPESAIVDLDAAWSNWRAALDERDATVWWGELGEPWGPFARHSLYDLVLHAHNELTHHAAEIALLRDLWRAGVR